MNLSDLTEFVVSDKFDGYECFLSISGLKEKALPIDGKSI